MRLHVCFYFGTHLHMSLFCYSDLNYELVLACPQLYDVARC